MVSISHSSIQNTSLPFLLHRFIDTTVLLQHHGSAIDTTVPPSHAPPPIYLAVVLKYLRSLICCCCFVSFAAETKSSNCQTLALIADDIVIRSSIRYQALSPINHSSSGKHLSQGNYLPQLVIAYLDHNEHSSETWLYLHNESNVIIHRHLKPRKTFS
ncbi:hypothetical protein QVD17_37011 [Tagetes erecta]|uniref:Uncharacterized protein n=1 Tax=Tagetes erecta TaxID=13708 RepID=A0AAD8JVS1_TARER|nr:hypothetical protein QVD17_37011 [Tagetes erecta]